MVILITGKAGAGKSTYAKRLVEELRGDGEFIYLLDSENIRGLNDDYSDQGREQHLMMMARMAKQLEEIGASVIIAAIAPKKEWRDKMRKFWKESLLVYLPGGTLWPGTTYERPTSSELVFPYPKEQQ